MTSYPDDLRELYYEFGRAAEMAQVMETEAGNLALVYATMLVDTSKITDEQREFFRALVQDVDKRTFGNLFREIQRIGQIDGSILDTVNAALEKRNYLTHPLGGRQEDHARGNRGNSSIPESCACRVIGYDGLVE